MPLGAAISTETFFTVAEETKLFLMSVVMGAGLGVLFDVFRALRVIFPVLKRDILTAAGDILFFVICGFVIYVFSVLFARGTVRAFYWAGAFLGGTIYLMTAGNIVMIIFRGFFGFVYGTIHKVYLYISKHIVELFGKYFTKIKVKFVSNAKKMKNT